MRSAPASGGGAYLVEVQGLRTLAALLVAIYHIWLGRVSGGVDVFFVVAAYFMVASLMRREPVGLRHILDYYAATARRVFPGAALVVAATVIASLFLLPQVEWHAQLVHAVSSLLFYENWKLIADGTDYLQQGLGASPFQQMWALAVQMQIYALFPLVYMLASAAGARWFGYRRWAVAFFALLFVVSLAYSVILTRSSQPYAYFSTFTRIWEFATGALLALLIHRIRVPRLAGVVLGWFGLALLIALGMLVDVSKQFPGYLAALPVLSAVAIIVAARSGARNPVLSSRPMVGLADLSFAFYLWHWPLLVLLRYQLGTESVGLYGIGVLLGALGLAYLSTKLVETPLRRWKRLDGRPWASLAVAVCALGAGGLAIGGWQLGYNQLMARAEARVAQLLADPGMDIPFGEVIPSLLIARDDTPMRPNNGCHQNQRSSKVLKCTFGDTKAERVVVLVGGSHAQHWLPALDAIGRREGFRVINITKSACLFAHPSQQSASCEKWNLAAMKVIEEMLPDLVVTTATRRSVKKGIADGDLVPNGYEGAWAQLAASGIKLLALRDNPWLNIDSPACVARNSAPWAECSRPVSEMLDAIPPYAELDTPNVTYADLTDLMCDTRCTSVRNGVLVYSDRTHLTRTFVLLHQDRVAAALLPLLPAQLPVP